MMPLLRVNLVPSGQGRLTTILLGCTDEQANAIVGLAAASQIQALPGSPVMEIERLEDIERTGGMMIEELWELVADLERRAYESRSLAQHYALGENINRAYGKSFAYQHAADLLADELRRQGA